MSSSPEGIRGFYAGKNFFITGGSGFLGICLLEKILRTIPQHGTIYLLLRPKKGKEINERLEEIKSNQIFETLLQQKTKDEIFQRVKVVAGDVGQDNLGLSPSDRDLLKQNVHVIVHSAATLDFGDTLKTTVDINLLGTRRITELAKECRNLKVLVHISSAYVNSWRLEADEVIYPLLTLSSNATIELVNKLSPEELEAKTPEILGDHPNTYTITKHMAELEVQAVEDLFPCAIVRPSMITAAWKEPQPGWTISKNGPQGFIMGASKGVVRRLPVAKELIYDYIPIDTVINNVLAAGYYAAATNAKKVQIFHCTSSTRNPFRWSLVEDSINKELHVYPLKSAVWYPHLKFLPTLTWFKISAFFVHFLPAVVLDFVTKIGGGRPILKKLHRNVNTSLDRLQKFIFTEWRFKATKTDELQKWLTPTDQIDFNLDVKSLNWVDYFINLMIGVRVYLTREPLKNLKSAKSKDRLLYILHVSLQAAILVQFWYFIACLIGTTMTKSVFVLPVLYGLFSIL